MKFKYEVDIKKLNLIEPIQEHLQKTGQKDIFESFVTNLLSAKYPQGFDDKMRRSHNRFLEKLDLSENGTIEVDTRDLDLLSEILLDEKLLTHPKQTRLFYALQANLKEVLEGQKEG